nr:uncharacterized protein LOC111518320 [Leptinotarsa decemlineata]
MEGGPPDSHEAMNNREEILPKIREKRSYEFLMGLINNNSRYEVTKVESEISTQKSTDISEKNVGASEILLELMVRIAAHPDQWNRVHKLLQSIDQDLVSSKNVFDKLKNSMKQQTHANVSSLKDDDILEENVHYQRNESKPKSDHNNTKKFERDYDRKNNRWPTFDDGSASVKFVNSNDTKVNGSRAAKTSWLSKPNRPTYPKNFAYHRVTGKPISLNQSPKAYIAVSVIAPKPANTRSNQEDITLENELRQLKPWTHNQNLQNMASIRSRWVIETEKDKKSTL